MHSWAVRIYFVATRLKKSPKGDPSSFSRVHRFYSEFRWITLRWEDHVPDRLPTMWMSMKPPTSSKWDPTINKLIQLQEPPPPKTNQKLSPGRSLISWWVSSWKVRDSLMSRFKQMPTSWPRSLSSGVRTLVESPLPTHHLIAPLHQMSITGVDAVGSKWQKKVQQSNPTEMFWVPYLELWSLTYTWEIAPKLEWEIRIWSISGSWSTTSLGSWQSGSSGHALGWSLTKEALIGTIM